MKYIGNHTEKSSKRLGAMDIILIFAAIVLLVFTAVMIYLFAVQGAIPDTLCTCVFAALGGEFGVMGWIKTNKDKLQNRKWEKEDSQTRQRTAKRKEKEDEH